MYVSIKNNSIADADMREVVECYLAAKPISKRKESDRFKRFSYAELMARDKANLDIFWLKDDSLTDTASLPKPALLAAEIMKDLEEALAEFSEVEAEFGRD